MQYQLFLLGFISHQFFSITNALSNHNQNNSLININLHQCNTNKTVINTTIMMIDPIFNSCNLTCCIENSSNVTSNLNTCQVTALSSTGVCLGRICYSGECDQFVSVTNLTYYQTILNDTTLLNTIPWSTLNNSIGIKWNLWKETGKYTITDYILILLLTTNISLIFVASSVIIKSISNAKMIAERKSRRYSLF
ncbi:unnamed protein product [Adineta steineri]|uniref:Glycoprotein n=1 Tax=Adineta steineri TaxID=433720 RepID=A0A818LPT4_9BILA|nr:unnamed protein product [Adineta steineri]CAF3575702.1 unnamed protein product [Adineta steineri]